MCMCAIHVIADPCVDPGPPACVNDISSPVAIAFAPQRLLEGPLHVHAHKYRLVRLLDVVTVHVCSIMD